MKKFLFSLAMIAGLMTVNAQTVVWSDDFNDEDISDWTIYDEDGDGNTWGDLFFVQDENQNPVSPISLISRSWQQAPLTPDNWVVSPAVDLSAVGGTITLKWKVQAAAASWDMENYSVYVATASDLTALEASSVTFTETYNDPADAGTQYERSLDLSSFAGETVYIAFRHHDVTDMDWLSIDDVSVEGEAGGPSEDCNQEVVSNNLENGLFLGGADNQRLAVDITVDAGNTMTISSIEPTIIIPEGSEATTFNFVFYADEAGLPGAEVDNATATISSSTVTGQNFGRDFIRYSLDLDADVVLEEGTYWMEMTSDAEGWEATTASVLGSTLVFNNASTTGEWVNDGEGTELVYELIATCETLGVSEMESFDFAYYPNPVKDELNITSQKSVQSVSVYNLAGQQISIQKLNVTNGKISTSSLTPGVYVFRAVLEGGQVETFKIIKK